jgi:hypothetical protein
MSTDLSAAERFIHANARLLERHRLAVLLHGAAVTPVLDALRAYRNQDGGFGHALEPDVRGPESEPASTLAALEVLVEIGTLDDPMVAGAGDWIGKIADPGGGVPFVMPAAAAHPRAPWMVPSDGGSHLTFVLAARLWEAGTDDPWLHRATDWCWARLERPETLSGYWVKFSLDFLDHVPDGARAASAIDRLRRQLGPDDSVPVPGGVEGERLTPLALSPRPGLRSRRLFGEGRIDAGLDALEAGQRDDGGWDFDFLHWSEGQAVEWRGVVTLQALGSLAAHERIRLPRAA